jgi:pyrimidine deaminase RibD-like protein
MADSIDIGFLKQAIEISKQTRPSEARFSVGAVLVDQNRSFVASGFTNELGDGWHAEAVAIKKALDGGFNPKGASIYSSLEPCSIRASGKESCTALLIEKEIVRVIFALSEPPIFVVGEGAKKLKQAGIKIEQVNSLEKSVIEINKHLLSNKAKGKESKLISYSLVMLTCCTVTQARALDPVDNSKLETEIKTQQPSPIAELYCRLLKQFGGIDKDDLRSRKIIDSQGNVNSNQISAEIDKLAIKDDQVKKSFELIKGLIYDPNNPSPFFNNLIALQSISASAQAQVISIAEKTLGPKNSYVVSLKENYNRTLKYVDALILQKTTLEQTMQRLHK